MHLTIKNINNIPPNDLKTTFYLLDKTCKNKINKLLTTEAIKQSLTGYFLLKENLYKLYKLNLHNLTIAYTVFGKPFIKDFPNIHYSISHSSKMVICGISNKQIGVDIEHIRKINIKSFYKYFNPNEIIYIEKQDSLHRFFKLWVLKEACFKMNNTLTDFKDIDIKIGNKISSNLKNCNLFLHDNTTYVIGICEKIDTL